MTREIEFVDGNSDTVVQRVRFEDVPLPNREIYLRQGIQVPSRDEADEIVAIARVVRLTLDEAGQLAPEAHATRAVIQEFDADGVLRRETVQVRA